MIYIDSSSTNIAIPCNITKGTTQYTLVLKNGITNTEYEYDVTDSMVSSLYYLFPITLDIENGEYTYFLYAGDNELVATGLLQFGKIEEPTVEKKYYTRQRTIKIYNR